MPTDRDLEFCDHLRGEVGNPTCSVGRVVGLCCSDPLGGCSAYAAPGSGDDPPVDEGPYLEEIGWLGQSFSPFFRATLLRCGERRLVVETRAVKGYERVVVVETVVCGARRMDLGSDAWVSDGVVDRSFASPRGREVEVDLGSPARGVEAATRQHENAVDRVVSYLESS